MSRHGKNYRNAAAKVEVKAYPLADAIRLATETAYAKFDETVDIAMRLGVDPKHADQMVRGTVVLPHGLGRSARVLVFAQGEKAKEAQAAGAGGLRLYVDETNTRAQAVYTSLGMNGGHYRVFEDMFAEPDNA